MIRLSDPKPAFCSACHSSHPDVRYVDFDAAHDGGNFVERDTQAYVEGSDDLHLCEPCLKRGMEVLALRPEVSSNQLRKIAELEKGNAHWRAYAKRLEATLVERPEPLPRRKAASVR